MCVLDISRTDWLDTKLRCMCICPLWNHLCFFLLWAGKFSLKIRVYSTSYPTMFWEVILSDAGCRYIRRVFGSWLSFACLLVLRLASLSLIGHDITSIRLQKALEVSSAKCENELGWLMKEVFRWVKGGRYFRGDFPASPLAFPHNGQDIWFESAPHPNNVECCRWPRRSRTWRSRWPRRPRCGPVFGCRS